MELSHNLKKHVRHDPTQFQLPLLDSEGVLAKEPIATKSEAIYVQKFCSDGVTVFRRMLHGRIFMICSRSILLLILEDKDAFEGGVLLQAKELLAVVILITC